MTLPRKIRVWVLTKDGRPAPDMFVGVWLQMPRKNSYDFVFAPCDQEGRVSLARDEILTAARRQAALFPRDYASPEEAADVRVKPLGEVELERLAGAEDTTSVAKNDQHAELAQARKAVPNWEPLRARIEVR